MNERTVQFAPGGNLLGTVCVPDVATAGPGCGLLLLNAGIVSRTGPHRINVRLAREAAALGIPSLRFDLSGRGDSTPAAPGLGYNEQAAADVAHAVDTLCREGPCERVMVFGICSGADDGLAAALSEPRIAALVLFDPPIFADLRWRLRMLAGKFRKYGIRGGIGRLLTIRRTLAAESGAENNYGRDVPPRAEYAARLRELVGRGVAIRLVYSGSTCTEPDYHGQRRAIVEAEGLADRIRTEFMPDVDHVVTTREAQSLLLSKMRDWMGGFRDGQEV